MPIRPLVAALFAALAIVPSARAEDDLCAGKTPGSITFFDQEVSRDAPLPPPVEEVEFGKPIYALACLTDEVQPQEAGGSGFRVVMYVKQLNIPEGQYSPYSEAKQEGGVLRPEISEARKDIVIWLHEDFDMDAVQAKLDPGEYELRLKAASEEGTGKLDVTFQVAQDNVSAYVQELRKAGYLADGRVKMVKVE